MNWTCIDSNWSHPHTMRIEPICIESDLHEPTFKGSLKLNCKVDWVVSHNYTIITTYHVRLWNPHARFLCEAFKVILQLNIVTLMLTHLAAIIYFLIINPIDHHGWFLKDWRDQSTDIAIWWQESIQSQLKRVQDIY